MRDEFRSFENAYAMGVNIAFGTDVGIYDHGQNALEFAVMVELGMSAADAIRSATLVTAELFNIAAEAGSIEAGKLSLEQVPFDLRELIDANLDLPWPVGPVVGWLGSVIVSPCGSPTTSPGASPPSVMRKGVTHRDGKTRPRLYALRITSSCPTGGRPRRSEAR